MRRKMLAWTRWLVLTAWLAALTGCGGGGEGTLRIEGTGADGFELFDASGNRQLYVGETGSETTLSPGRYAVFVNGAGARVQVRAGRQLVVRLAALTVEGLGVDAYEVFDPSGERAMFSRPIGTPAELLAGTYQIKLNGVFKTLELNEGESKTIRTGALQAPEQGPPMVTVYDTAGRRLVFRGAGKPIELLAGTYVADYAGKKRTVEIKAGEVTELTP